MQNYQGGNPNPYPYATPPPLHAQQGQDPTRTAPPSTSVQQPPPQHQQQPHQQQHHQPLQYQQPPPAQYQQQPVHYQQVPVVYQQQAPQYQPQQSVQQHHQFAPQAQQPHQTPQAAHPDWHQTSPQAVTAPQYSPQSQFPPQQQQQQQQYGAPAQPLQPAGTPQPAQFPQHQYGAVSQSPQPVTTPQQSQPGQFPQQQQQQQQQQYGALSQPPRPVTTPQQSQPGQVPQQQHQQYGVPLQARPFPGASQQQQQQFGALPQHLQPAASPSPQQTPPVQLPQQHQYGVPAQSPQTATAPQHSPQGQFLPQQQYGALPQTPTVGTPQQVPPGQMPQQQQQQHQQYGAPQPQSPGFPVAYQYGFAAPTPHGQQPTTTFGQAPGLPGQPAPYGYGGPGGHARPIPLTKTSTGLKSRFGATVAGFQSKLGTYMAKVQTPPSSAYPGAPGAAPTMYGQPYGQQPLQSPQAGIRYGQQPPMQGAQGQIVQPVGPFGQQTQATQSPYGHSTPAPPLPQPMQGAQGQVMQPGGPFGQQTQATQSPYGHSTPAPLLYGQRPQPPQTQPAPATFAAPQYRQQLQQSQQHVQSSAPYDQQPPPPQNVQRQTSFPAAPTGQAPTAAPLYGQSTQTPTPQGTQQSVYGSVQGYPTPPYQTGAGSPYPVSGAAAVQGAMPGYPPQQAIATPVSPPAPWQPYQSPSQQPTYSNASPSATTPAPSSPFPAGTPAQGLPLTGTPAVGTPAMPRPVAHGQGLPQWTRHTSYDLSAAQQQQGHPSHPITHQPTASISSTTQSFASEHGPAQPTTVENATPATSAPAQAPEPSQYGHVDLQQPSDLPSSQPPTNPTSQPASAQGGPGEEPQGQVQQSATLETSQADTSIPAQLSAYRLPDAQPPQSDIPGQPTPHSDVAPDVSVAAQSPPRPTATQANAHWPQQVPHMQQPTHTFARKPVSPPSTEPPPQQHAPHHDQTLTAPYPQQQPGQTLEPSGPAPAATPESQQSPPSDSWSISALTSQIQDLLVADPPVHPDPAPADHQHQPHTPNAQVSALAAISANPYPVNGETLATDYFLHPMLTAPFSDTPTTRCCQGNSKIDQSRTWFFHPTTPSFPICGFCYLTFIAPTKFGLEFASRNEKDLHCHFHAPRITRVLWPQALASDDMASVVAYMARRSTELRFCGGPEGRHKSDGIKWFLPPVLDDKGNPGYCEACYEDLIVGGPFEGRLMAGVKEQPDEEEWYCTSWNNGFTRMILKGDWEQFLQHTAARFNLPACDGQVGMASQARWWTLRGMGPETAFHMCETCYLDDFKDSRWEGIVEECGPLAGQARGCSYSPSKNLNLRVAVALATQKRLGAEELRRILFTIASKPTCGSQEPSQDGRYYNFRGTPAAEYGICEACFETRIRPLGLGQFFTDAPQVVSGATYCSFSPFAISAGFFMSLFIEAVETGVWAVYEERVRAIANVRPCAGIDAMQGGRWWGWPDCTICEHCFQNFAFGTKFASEMPLQGIIGSPDESRICGLFSNGQRKRYLDACENNKLDEFLEFCRERQTKWAELWPAIQRLQAQISSTYWAGVNLSIVSHGNKMSDAITFVEPTTQYIAGSGKRYNSYSGAVSEQQEAQADALTRQGAGPMEEQKRLLAIWSLWE